MKLPSIGYNSQILFLYKIRKQQPSLCLKILGSIIDHWQSNMGQNFGVKLPNLLYLKQKFLVNDKWKMLDYKHKKVSPRQPKQIERTPYS